jgi:N-acyl-D-amino-acid deacylase
VLDLLFKDVRLVDGTGRPWRRADVGVASGRVIEVGRVDGRTHRLIRGDGRVLAPGFIDMHAHSDLSVICNGAQEMKIAQGVTLELVAQDGLGCAPVRDEAKERVSGLIAGLVGTAPDWSWNSVAGYLDALDRACAVNVATLAPHGTIRCDLLDGEDRPAAEAEVRAMARTVERAMLDGAFGFSTGLEYEPTTAATTDEVVVLAAAAGRLGGFYVTHVRDYDVAFLPALEEALEIGRRGDTPVHYSHYHCYGRRNFGLGAEIRRRADEARRANLDVSFDVYPYTAGSTYAHYFLSRDPRVRTIAGLRSVLADRAERARVLEALDRDGPPIDIGWNQCFVGAGADLVDASERSLQEIADARGSSPGEVLLELVERSQFTATIVGFMLDAQDVDGTVCHPLATLGSDAILLGERPHPRGWGAFAKIIRKYVVERSAMTIEAAICMMTGRPAARLALEDRGLILPGYWADLVLFEPTAVRDEATYQEPTRLATGFDVVTVNGEVVWEEGSATGLRPGRALRSRAWQRTASPVDRQAVP